MAKKPTKGVSVSAPIGRDASLRVRQISNGYIVSTEKQTKNGYVQTEKFHPKKPTIKIS